MQSGSHDLLKISAVGCFLVLSACESWPTAERDAALCAQRVLAGTPGVSDVELYSGGRLIVGYTYLDQTGKLVRSRIRIGEWTAPGEAVSYYYEIIDNEFMGSGSYDRYDVRNLMAKCDLGLVTTVD
jgi:hypothetical protein